MVVKVAETKQEREDAYYVRRTVFVEEQHVPIEAEIDQFEDEAVHFVLYNEDKESVGAGRYRVIDGIAKAERVCVLPTGRGKGSGVLIMNALEAHAKERGLAQMKLSAQVHAIPFYEKLGYHTCSEEYLDQNIPHRLMIKTL